MISIQIRNIILLLFIFITVACETGVNLVEAPEFEQKLVITAFISPSDKISYFRVSSNRKLYGELETEDPLGLLSGTISDGSNEAALDTFRYGLMLSSEKMQIQYGKKYKIRVSSEKGLNAEAECTVPERKNFIIEVDTFSILTDNGYYSPFPGVYRSLKIKVRFSDLPGEENYYRIIGRFRGYSSKYGIKGYVEFDKEYISDKGMDGRNIVLNSDQESGYALSSAKDSLFLNIYLYNTEKSYFTYHKSLEGYESGENPFTEASPVFSNITGGFGIFTSYTIDSLLVRLK
jgi:hypothetical protein